MTHYFVEYAIFIRLLLHSFILCNHVKDGLLEKGWVVFCESSL